MLERKPDSETKVHGSNPNATAVCSMTVNVIRLQFLQVHNYKLKLDYF